MKTIAAIHNSAISRPDFRGMLLHSRAIAFVQNQFVENGQHLLAELINPAKALAESRLIPARLDPLGQDIARDVDVAAQGLGRVSAEEQAIEHGRLVATVYPSVATLAQATPIMLQADDRVSSVVILAQRQETYAIRGRLSGLGGLAAGAIMNLSPADEEQTVIVAGGGNVEDDNSFEFDDVSPSNYTITYLDQAPSYVRTHVAVTTGDVHNVTISPPATVRTKGRISFVDSVPAELAELGRVVLALRPAVDRVVSPVFIARISDDGSFTFEKAVPPGKYRARIDVPEGYYVKAVHLSDVDVTGGLINMPESAVISLSSSAAGQDNWMCGSNEAIR